VTELSITPPPAVLMTEQGRLAGRPGTVALHAEAVQRAITAMHERLDEPLSLDTMAAIAILSRYHFSRVFHQLTGLPPARFLAALRLAEAKRLLLTTQLSVTDICFRVGYNSLGTFTMRFTQSVGISPGRFRQLPHRGLPAGSIALEPPNEGQVNSGGVVAGRVVGPASLTGPVFIGLFASSVPEGRPRRCAAMVSQGEYRMEDVPNGSYHVFAVSFPLPTEPLALLLPEHDSLNVGRSGRAVGVRSGQGTERADLRLRRATLIDPPVLVALPLLFAEQMEREATSA
jgi:AraC family transcriptional regulator